jgi:hypothetical protein
MHALLHPSVVALVTLAAHAACGDNDGAAEAVAKLKEHGLRESQLDLAVSVARRVRDAARLDQPALHAVDAELDRLIEAAYAD